MIQSTAFNYINVLDKAADASWNRESIISNNLANVNTPGYKRKDLDFETVLQDELLSEAKVTDKLDKRINNTDLELLDPQVFIDHSKYSYRLDGNNVDIDTEEVELASEQLKYQGLTTAVNQEFARMRAVIK